MTWHVFFNFLLGTLAIIGMASVIGCIITVWMLSRHGDEPDDEWHRMEDEEQVEYLRKWKEKHDRR